MRLAVIAAAMIGGPLLLGAQAPSPAPGDYGAPFTARPYGSGAVKVGPPHGAVIVVGGGSMGPEVYRAFIDAAGGPDALILDVPNAGGADGAPASAGRGWRDNGARNVDVLFTRDRAVAESDSFTARIGRAGGVWFDGGRQFHLVQDYGGTATERAIMGVLERGGVVGGSSAGASILGDFMVRGAPSNDNSVMDAPGYERGFGYLRNVGIDQHVVARSRLPDLADSIVARYPAMLAISADEGTAWVIRGDTGTIVGRNKAFVYNGHDATDAGAPFLTLYPGDRYDLAARRVLSRASDRSPVALAMVDSIFARWNDPARGGATVLVARDGNVFVDRAYGIPAQPRFMPRTTLPLFDVGDMAGAFTALCAQMPTRAAPAAPVTRRGPPPSPLEECVARVSSPIGAHHSAADSSTVRASVDELYRLALGLESTATFRVANPALGWRIDPRPTGTRYLVTYDSTGRRAAMLRVPDHHATVIVLTRDESVDARGIVERLMDRVVDGQ